MVQTAPTVTFQRQTIADCYQEIRPLLEAHCQEVAYFNDLTLCVDWESYIRMEQAGALRLYVVRDYGALRGYAAFFVRHHIHYLTSLQATADVVYLDPSMRQGMTGSKFLEWCNDQLREEGVQIVAHHSSVRHELGPLFQRLGYKLAETVWVKRLDGE